VDCHKLHSTGDSVVAEMMIKGPAFNGRRFENASCIVFEIAEDKIRAGRIYVDVADVARIFDA